MDIGLGVFNVVLSIILLIISVLQFKEKGFLLNNAYILASKKEREEMDSNKEMKRPHYRQSGYVFLFLGIAFGINAMYCFFDLHWLFTLFWIMIIVTVIYAVVSSIKMELHK